MAARDRYRHLLEEISETALACGRNPKEITLVAVSKGYPWDLVQPAYDAGCRVFGESRMQEALAKITAAPTDIHWHFIGTLQKNKVAKAIGAFSLLHSVDTPELALKISQCSEERGIVTPILLQVNTSGEASKQGLSEELWKPHLESIFQLPSIRIEGLMAMAPFVEEEKVIRSCFSRLRQIRDRYRLSHLSLRHLSMGMSHDYRIAVQEGATLLRIGTAIFKS
ncbi:MAG: YggS family pyridoxal phosphate-dependent enzyme [Parachlamydia sp.]|nr:YggS family pyridoxal phosphate-dependent enzyme [Parachlamydia sp.]